MIVTIKTKILSGERVMKIENNYYIVIKEENNKTMYLTTEDTLTDNIRDVAKAVNRTTAYYLIDAYKDTKYWSREITKEECEDNEYTLGLKVVPLKITYEYE